MVLWAEEEWQPQASHRGPHPAAAGPPQSASIRQFLLTNLVEVDGRFVWRLNLDALAQHLDKILDFPYDKKPTLGQPSSSGVETLSSCRKVRLGGRTLRSIPDSPSPSTTCCWGGLGCE